MKKCPSDSVFWQRPRLFIVMAVALCFGAAEALAAVELVVKVKEGDLRGVDLAESKGVVFRGIPYAQPPVGKLRWREPMPAAAWAGIRDATKSGPPAAQSNFGWNEESAAASREDCLYLDVWTPRIAVKPKLPVMIWFHGGGNVAGAGGFDPVYNGERLISRGVVLVVVEYRLGIFGFLAHPELTRESPHHASGNYAILDQLAAIRWVHDNIAAFGGDAGNVTIFGQSAGGMDVLALMSSPLSEGLIHRAIAESPGPPLQSSVSLADAEREGVEAVSKLNPPKDGGLEYLRSQPVQALLNLRANLRPFCTDGWVFPDSSSHIWYEGKTNRVPLIVGTAAIEFPFSGGAGAIPETMKAVFGANASKALAFYGLSDGAQPRGADPIYGDVWEQLGSEFFRAPAIMYGEHHSLAGNPVWEYQFDRPIPPQPKVGHSGDIPYVFGVFDLKKGNLVGQYGDDDRRLSDEIQTYWTNFAKTGSPNGKSVLYWPEYDAKNRRYLEFTAAATIVTGANQRGAIIDLFRAAWHDAEAAK